MSNEHVVMLYNELRGMLARYSALVAVGEAWEKSQRRAEDAIGARMRTIELVRDCPMLLRRVIRLVNEAVANNPGVAKTHEALMQAVSPLVWLYEASGVDSGSPAIGRIPDSFRERFRFEEERLEDLLCHRFVYGVKWMLDALCEVARFLPESGVGQPELHYESRAKALNDILDWVEESQANDPEFERRNAIVFAQMADVATLERMKNTDPDQWLEIFRAMYDRGNDASH